MQTISIPATVGHFIGGHPVEPKPDSRFGDIYDPALGIVQRRVAFADDATIDRAVKAARASFAIWGRTPLGKRAEVLIAFREKVRSHFDEFAKIVSNEHGKIVSDAGGEVTRALEVIDFACQLTHQMKGEMSESVSNNIDTYSIRQPVGVCVGITPFNFPMMVPIWMLAPALAAGNSFVLKPSERDPSASLLMARLLQESGLPDGAFNVVHGDKSAVDALLRHPDVGRIKAAARGEAAI